jgi:hypothetical protein
MINVPYRLATVLARLRRRRYLANLDHILACPLRPSAQLACRLVAFSGESDLPEQVASLRSFLLHAGLPEEILVVSDGTHRPESLERLQRVHPAVKVASCTGFLRPGLPEPVIRYARQHPLGKKLAVFLSLAGDKPTVYSDSDVLYFPAAAELRQLVADTETRPRYLLDCWPSLDERLLASEDEKTQPVNTGFLLLRKQLEWDAALARLEKMGGEPGFFTEQTVTHLAVRASGGIPLPPERYVIRNEDQWLYGDLFAGQSVVLRHYISSLRHKMWLRVNAS